MFKKFVLKNACDGHSWVGQGELRQKESSDYDISITLLIRKKEERRVILACVSEKDTWEGGKRKEEVKKEIRSERRKERKKKVKLQKRENF